MDISAEGFQTGLLVLLQKRCARETDKDGIGEDRLHGLVELTGLSAVTLIHKYHDITFCGEILGQSVFQIFDVFLIVRFRALVHNLVDFPYLPRFWLVKASQSFVMERLGSIFLKTIPAQ